MLISGLREGSDVKEQQASPARITQSILPALKTYSGTSIAVTGCHATRSSRESCEYDLLVVGEELLAAKSIRVKNLYADLIFVREKDIRQVSDPEFALTLSTLVPLRDIEWVLATASSQAKKSLKESSAWASKNRLSSALKALGRVDENLSEGKLEGADFWLLSAGYDFSLSILYSGGTIASPSHLLSQMKKGPKRPHSSFKEWADSVGLPLASRETSENRLGGLMVLYDVLRTVELDASLASPLARYRSKDAEEIVRRKAGYLLDTLLSTESFAYLGFELVRTMVDLLRYQAAKLGREPVHQEIIESLTKGSDRLLSEQVIRSLGLVRSRNMLMASSQALRESIAQQARGI